VWVRELTSFQVSDGVAGQTGVRGGLLLGQPDIPAQEA
jgi:hypothetical protein